MTMSSRWDAHRWDSRERPRGKEHAEGPAWWSKCPGSDRESGEDEGRPDDGSRVTAAYDARGKRTRQFEEEAGIRPFLEPRQPWCKQSDASKQFPHAQDREHVHRVALVCHDLDDRLASHQL